MGGGCHCAFFGSRDPGANAAREAPEVSPRRRPRPPPSNRAPTLPQSHQSDFEKTFRSYFIR